MIVLSSPTPAAAASGGGFQTAPIGSVVNALNGTTNSSSSRRSKKINTAAVLHKTLEVQPELQTGDVETITADDVNMSTTTSHGNVSIIHNNNNNNSYNQAHPDLDAEAANVIANVMRKAEEEACARELLQLKDPQQTGTTSGRRVLIRTGDGDSEFILLEEDELHGAGVRPMIMEMPDINKLTSSIQIPNLDGNITDVDTDDEENDEGRDPIPKVASLIAPIPTIPLPTEQSTSANASNSSSTLSISIPPSISGVSPPAAKRKSHSIMSLLGVTDDEDEENPPGHESVDDAVKGATSNKSEEAKITSFVSQSEPREEALKPVVGKDREPQSSPNNASETTDDPLAEKKSERDSDGHFGESVASAQRFDSATDVNHETSRSVSSCNNDKIETVPNEKEMKKDEHLATSSNLLSPTQSTSPPSLSPSLENITSDLLNKGTEIEKQVDKDNTKNCELVSTGDEENKVGMRQEEESASNSVADQEKYSSDSAVIPDLEKALENKVTNNSDQTSEKNPLPHEKLDSVIAPEINSLENVSDKDVEKSCRGIESIGGPTFPQTDQTETKFALSHEESDETKKVSDGTKKLEDTENESVAPVIEETKELVVGVNIVLPNSSKLENGPITLEAGTEEESEAMKTEKIFEKGDKNSDETVGVSEEMVKSEVEKASESHNRESEKRMVCPEGNEFKEANTDQETILGETDEENSLAVCGTIDHRNQDSNDPKETTAISIVAPESPQGVILDQTVGFEVPTGDTEKEGSEDEVEKELCVPGEKPHKDVSEKEIIKNLENPEKGPPDEASGEQDQSVATHKSTCSEELKFPLPDKPVPSNHIEEQNDLITISEEPVMLKEILIDPRTETEEDSKLSTVPGHKKIMGAVEEQSGRPTVLECPASRSTDGQHDSIDSLTVLLDEETSPTVLLEQVKVTTSAQKNQGETDHVKTEENRKKEDILPKAAMIVIHDETECTDENRGDKNEEGSSKVEEVKPVRSSEKVSMEGSEEEDKRSTERIGPLNSPKKGEGHPVSVSNNEEVKEPGVDLDKIGQVPNSQKAFENMITKEDENRGNHVGPEKQAPEKSSMEVTKETSIESNKILGPSLDDAPRAEKTPEESAIELAVSAKEAAVEFLQSSESSLDPVSRAQEEEEVSKGIGEKPSEAAQSLKSSKDAHVRLKTGEVAGEPKPSSSAKETPAEVSEEPEASTRSRPEGKDENLSQSECTVTSVEEAFQTRIGKNTVPRESRQTTPDPKDEQILSTLESTMVSNKDSESKSPRTSSDDPREGWPKPSTTNEVETEAKTETETRAHFEATVREDGTLLTKDQPNPPDHPESQIKSAEDPSTSTGKEIQPRETQIVPKTITPKSSPSNSDPVITVPSKDSNLIKGKQDEKKVAVDEPQLDLTPSTAPEIKVVDPQTLETDAESPIGTAPAASTESSSTTTSTTTTATATHSDSEPVTKPAVPEPRTLESSTSQAMDSAESKSSNLVESDSSESESEEETRPANNNPGASAATANVSSTESRPATVIRILPEPQSSAAPPPPESPSDLKLSKAGATTASSTTLALSGSASGAIPSTSHGNTTAISSGSVTISTTTLNACDKSSQKPPSSIPTESANPCSLLGASSLSSSSSSSSSDNVSSVVSTPVVVQDENTSTIPSSPPSSLSPISSPKATAVKMDSTPLSSSSSSSPPPPSIAPVITASSSTFPLTSSSSLSFSSLAASESSSTTPVSVAVSNSMSSSSCLTPSSATSIVVGLQPQTLNDSAAAATITETVSNNSSVESLVTSSLHSSTIDTRTTTTTVSSGGIGLQSEELEQQKHLAPLKPNTCNVCGKECKNEADLFIHKKRHKVDAPLTCHFCSRQYLDKRRYDIHIRLHTGETPFKCPMCGKGFRDERKMILHHKRHTSDLGHKCHLCPRSFEGPKALQKHLNAHVNNRYVAPKVIQKADGSTAMKLPDDPNQKRTTTTSAGTFGSSSSQADMINSSIALAATTSSSSFGSSYQGRAVNNTSIALIAPTPVLSHGIVGANIKDHVTPVPANSMPPGAVGPPPSVVETSSITSLSLLSQQQQQQQPLSKNNSQQIIQQIQDQQLQFGSSNISINVSSAQTTLAHGSNPMPAVIGNLPAEGRTSIQTASADVVPLPNATADIDEQEGTISLSMDELLRYAAPMPDPVIQDASSTAPVSNPIDLDAFSSDPSVNPMMTKTVPVGMDEFISPSLSSAACEDKTKELEDVDEEEEDEGENDNFGDSNDFPDLLESGNGFNFGKFSSKRRRNKLQKDESGLTFATLSGVTPEYPKEEKEMKTESHQQSEPPQVPIVVARKSVAPAEIKLENEPHAAAVPSAPGPRLTFNPAQLPPNAQHLVQAIASEAVAQLAKARINLPAGTLLVPAESKSEGKCSSNSTGAGAADIARAEGITLPPGLQVEL